MLTYVKRMAVLMVLAAAVQGRAALTVSDQNVEGGFGLVVGGKAAAVVVDVADATVVHIAAALVARDVEAVSGAKVNVNVGGKGEGRVIVAGTLGVSKEIDRLVKEGKVAADDIRGKWESYKVVRVGSGPEETLVIVGSDRRGTAYGLLEVSETLGVSPWEWWADVKPTKRRGDLYLSGGKVQGPPSVKFRGIFINDEDFGLQPWAAKTFEPETKDIGPKTYAKVFELLLRLRANLCWPAMHPSTKAFNLYPQNKQVADDYAIVMGASHCEPMLRNNVTEWPHDKEKDYNYVTNRDGVLGYWRERVKENGKFENIYTLGMRGIHDSDMAGGGTRQERAARLNAIMKDQREMLSELVNKDVAKVPQLFCPYKEVLLLYQAGAVPADDVTLVWADDNHGYIRNLSTPAEQKRSGGSGVYYHLSYWGRPHDYLWLSTIQPSLIWEEMSKAYDYGARNFWVFNVGDIKPAEINTTLALRMAYDMGRYTRENIGGYFGAVAQEMFGEAHGKEIGEVLRQLNTLNYQRKPEHLGFNVSQGTGSREVMPSAFSTAEILERLAAFEELVEKADALYEAMPAEKKDAFFQIVAYPVRCSALQNEKMLGWDMNRRAAEKREWDEALRWQERSMKAFNRIAVETKVYNEGIAGGKWKGIMSQPRNLPVWAALKYAALPAGTGAGFDPTETLPKAPAPKPVVAPKEPAFKEVKGYVSIGAEHFTKKTDKGEAGWQVIKELGRAGDSMAIFPTTAATVPAEKVTELAPLLEYALETTTASDAAEIVVQAVPTHRINMERGLRYAIAVDDQTPQVVDLESPEFSAVWDENVLRGAALGATKHKMPAGKHMVRIYMVDPGVVLDHLTIDLGGLPKGYLPPKETFVEH